MRQRSSQFGADPFEVSSCEPMDTFLYLSPGSRQLVQCTAAKPPPRHNPASPLFRTVRVVCVSDTHNEHHGLRLPAGDVLIHAGDCLTETGQRGYVKRTRGVTEEVTREGLGILEHFAEWFGALDFPHKVLIGGNHDLVLEALGKAGVQETLDRATKRGQCHYLEHEETSVDGLRVFGSPFSHWGGKNDAFFQDRSNYDDMREGVHIMITHSPPMLPRRGGHTDEDFRTTDALHRCGSLLHVSGHCHWAHGLYHSERNSHHIPCVVASVCGGEMYGGPWKDSKPHLLKSATGIRGDPLDRKFGGYNVSQPPIVCDLEVPIRESANDASVLAAARQNSESPQQCEIGCTCKPAVLMFGPSNDPDFVREVLFRLRESFDVDFVDSSSSGIQAVKDRVYMACIAKLGTKGNLGYDIIDALRKTQGMSPFVAIHSQTASANAQLQQRLSQELSVNLFVRTGDEDDLVEALKRHAHN